MKSKTFPLLPDIAGIYCLVIFAAVLLTGKLLLSDGDTHWHIKVGSVMIERGAILTEDIFSHTVSGQPWTSHEWLAEIIMASVHQVAGLAGVAAFFSLMVALTFWLLFRVALRGGSTWTAIFAVSIAFGLASTHLLARPHLFSWFFGVITLTLLLRGGKALYTLPLLTILWANIHGGFILGLFLQGLFIAGHILDSSPGMDWERWKDILRECRTPLFALTLTVLAVGINPFGYQILLFFFSVSKPVYSAVIDEWLPPDFHEMWYFRLYLLLIILLLTLGKVNTTWRDRLFLLFFINASLIHQRNVSLAGIFLTPFLAGSLEEERKRFISKTSPSKENGQLRLSSASGPIVTSVLALLVVLAAATGSPSWNRYSEKLFPLPDDYSQAALAFLENNPLEGNMLNEYTQGDYLVYATDYKVFIDGRADMYGEKVFGDYRKIVSLDKDTDDLLSRYKIGWVFFPTLHPLTRYLLNSGEWNPVFSDEKVSILVRN